MTLKKLNKAIRISDEINSISVQIAECKKAIKCFKEGIYVFPLFHNEMEAKPIAKFCNLTIKDKDFNVLCLELYLERLQKRRELLLADFRQL